MLSCTLSKHRRKPVWSCRAVWAKPQGCGPWGQREALQTVLDPGLCAALSLPSSGQLDLRALVARLSFPSSIQHLPCTDSEPGPLLASGQNTQRLPTELQARGEVENPSPDKINAVAKVSEGTDGCGRWTRTVLSVNPGSRDLERPRPGRVVALVKWLTLYLWHKKRPGIFF